MLKLALVVLSLLGSALFFFTSGATVDSAAVRNRLPARAPVPTVMEVAEHADPDFGASLRTLRSAQHGGGDTPSAAVSLLQSYLEVLLAIVTALVARRVVITVFRTLVPRLQRVLLVALRSAARRVSILVGWLAQRHLLVFLWCSVLVALVLALVLLGARMGCGSCGQICCLLAPLRNH